MEKTEAQIDREKQAVAAMSNAKSNMTTALDRITTLENRLRTANSVLSIVRNHVGPHSKIPVDSGHELVVKYIGDEMSKIAITLP